MTRFETLAPEEALQRADREGWAALVFPLAKFCLQFGLSEAEVRREAAAGRLVVHGFADGRGGYQDCHISAQDYLRWQVNPATPKRLTQKVARFLNAKPS